VKLIQGHEGEVYAILKWGDYLLSIGMEDARLKLWSKNLNDTSWDFQAPKGVISAAQIDNGEDKLILIEGNGLAGTYELNEKELKLVSRIPGKDFRMVFNYPRNRDRVFSETHLINEVTQISREIAENFSQLSDDNLKELHSRLIELGYKHVSLALQIEQNVQEGEIVEALSRCSLLLNILPENHRETCPSMETYASILEKAWHIQQANEVCREILKIDSNYRFSIATQNLTKISELLTSSHCFIEQDIPIDEIINSATAINEKLSGHYVIKQLPPEACGHIKLTSEMILKKYEQVCNESKSKELPKPSIKKLWWISRDGYKSIELIILGDGKTNNVEGLLFCLQVLGSDLGTVLVPWILFDWTVNENRATAKEHNKKALTALINIKNKAVSNPYLSAVHKTLKQAIRRLVTEMSQQRSLH